jgi:hypothetical protein
MMHLHMMQHQVKDVKSGFSPSNITSLLVRADAVMQTIFFSSPWKSCRRWVSPLVHSFFI